MDKFVPGYIIKQPVRDLQGRTEIREWTVGAKLGQGGFSTVFEVQKQNTIYAVKIVHKKRLKREEAKAHFVSEVKIHRSLNHQNICRFIDFYDDDEYAYMFLEYCNCETLHEMLKYRKVITEIEAQVLMRQLLTALMYLYQNRVVHRDLKVANIFLGQNMEIKIGDFGCCHQLSSFDETLLEFCGTPIYISPEMIKGGGYSLEIDVWAFAIIFYTLLCGRPPFYSKLKERMYEKIVQGVLEFPSHVSEEAKDLIVHCLFQNPRKRPTYEQILQHRFFAMNKFPRYLQPSFLKTRPDAKFLLKWQPFIKDNQLEYLTLIQQEVQLCLPKGMSEDAMYSDVKQQLKDCKIKTIDLTEQERVRKLRNGGGDVALKNRRLHDQQQIQLPPKSKSKQNLKIDCDTLSNASRNPQPQDLDYVESESPLRGSKQDLLNTPQYTSKKPPKLTPLNKDKLLSVSPRKGGGSSRRSSKQGLLSARKHSSNNLPQSIEVDQLVSMKTLKRTQSNINEKAENAAKSNFLSVLPLPAHQGRQTSIVVGTKGANILEQFRQDQAKLGVENLQVNSLVGSPNGSVNNSARGSARGSAKGSARGSARSNQSKRSRRNSARKNKEQKEEQKEETKVEIKEDLREEPRQKPNLPPSVYLSKWADYSAKYGLGFMLNEGSTGVFFNDLSKMVANSDQFCIIQKNNKDQETFTFSGFPKDNMALQKKVTLLQHFGNYLGKKVDTSSSRLQHKSQRKVPVGSVFVKKWLKLSHGMVFVFNYGLVQVAFKDRTELFINMKTKLVTFISRDGETQTIPYAEAVQLQSNNEIFKRLKYTKEELKKHESEKNQIQKNDIEKQRLVNNIKEPQQKDLSPMQPVKKMRKNSSRRIIIDTAQDPAVGAL